MSSRLKAFMIHLTGSLILASCALALVFLVWYPSPLDQALGVTHIFLLMLGIDVIVGPILTLLIYKTDLRLLKFDLTVIIIVQLAVFSYGIYTVAKGRPAWLVFSTDQFYLVRTTDVDTDNATKAQSIYRHASWFGPQWVAVILPTDRKQRSQLVSATLQAGSGLFTSPNLYGSLDKAETKIKMKSHPLTELSQYNRSNSISTTLAKWKTATTWMPLWSDPKGMTVLLDKNNHVVSIVQLNPWNQ